MPRIPLVEDLTTGPIPTGSNILVEFDPASQWYNASLTITAGWIRSGGTASYNVYNQPPESVRLQLKRLRFNDEKSFIDFWRTRVIPNAPTRNSTVMHSLVKGVYSEYIYKTLETSADGIIDVKIDEEGSEVKNLMRIRNIRSVGYDSRWCGLKIGENFEVTLEK